MFYLTKLDLELRFGDVLVQQLLLSSHLSITPGDLNESNLQIEIKKANYSVILTPCCSIDNEMIVVAPFKKINSKWLRNPYFAEDLTRINREMNPEQSVSANVWGKMPQEERYKRLQEGYGYTSLNTFIYPEHENIEKYKISMGKSSIEIGYYQIDFRDITSLSSKEIMSIDGLFLTRKIAQLSIDARSDLRNKIGRYYARVPKEDFVLDD